MRRLLTVVFTAWVVIFIGATPAQASPITEVEFNGTLASAQVLPSSAFSLPVPGTVFDPPGYPTATISGNVSGANDVDFFGFTVSGASLAYFDIDNDPFTFDSIVSLFDSVGTLIGLDDDSFPADPGSASGGDAFLGVISLPVAGTYYVAVSGFANFPSAVGSGVPTALFRPDGAPGGVSVAGATAGDSSFIGGSAAGPYTLHMSVQSTQAVPEPTSMLLVGGGLASLVMRRYRSRQKSA